jgi:hypothetical protein
LSHSAYILDRITVHYRWSAWFGRTLPVVRRIDHGHGDWLVCELPGGSTQAIPTWMTDAAVCATFSAGPPEVAVTALAELLSFLRALNSSVKADRQSEDQPSREHLDEAIEIDE